jgi:hypothetical protein
VKCCVTTCKRAAAPGRASCATCLRGRALLAREYRERNRAAGLCYHCDAPTVPGLKLCPHHRDYEAARRKLTKTKRARVLGRIGRAA